MCSSAAAVGQRDGSLGYCCLSVISMHSGHLYSDVLRQRSTMILNILAKAIAAYHICFLSQAILCNLWNWFLKVPVDQKMVNTQPVWHQQPCQVQSHLNHPSISCTQGRLTSMFFGLCEEAKEPGENLCRYWEHMHALHTERPNNILKIWQRNVWKQNEFSINSKWVSDKWPLHWLTSSPSPQRL